VCSLYAAYSDKIDWQNTAHVVVNLLCCYAICLKRLLALCSNTLYLWKRERVFPYGSCSYIISTSDSELNFNSDGVDPSI